MLIVQKYGGATLADPKKIRAVAGKISELTQADHRVVAVVSAMGQTTNDLMALARQISEQPNRRELDMLLSTGERVSMALLSMALHDHKCDAISLTGSQAGILTNEAHVNALITDVRAFRVSQSLQAGKIVVIAGFQGVSPLTKEITTLGRGGTDTTAIAIAVYLKADRCEILKEVDGVLTADPRVVPKARRLKNLSYQQLAHMCFWGAKVVHYRAAELAARNKIPLYVGLAQSAGDHNGTWIKGEAMYETAQILSLNSHDQVLVCEGNFASTGEAITALEGFLSKHELGWPQILQTTTVGNKQQIWLTGPAELAQGVEKVCVANAAFQIKERLSAVTATCSGSVSYELATKVFSLLAEKKIVVRATLNTALGISLFVEPRMKNEAVNQLHSLITI